jgi:ABC-type Fe2+-enterobactin transport system substrate-binding protein
MSLDNPTTTVQELYDELNVTTANQVIAYYKEQAWGELAKRVGLSSGCVSTDIIQHINKDPQQSWDTLAEELGLSTDTERVELNVSGASVYTYANSFSRVIKYYNLLGKARLAERIGLSSDCEWSEIRENLQ